MPVELEEFILKHKNLSGNKILKLYRKSGYHINTQKFYEIKKGIDNKNKKKNMKQKGLVYHSLLSRFLRAASI